MSDLTELSRAVLDTVDRFEREHSLQLPAAVRMITSAPGSSVVVTGVGKSFIVAELAAALLRSVGIRAVACHATDMLHGDLNFLPRNGRGAVVIGISHSGQTTELLEALAAARDRDAFVITIASNTNAWTNVWLGYDLERDGSKHGTIPTASVTAQLAWVNEIVCAIADDVSNHDLLAGHQHGALGSTYSERSNT